MASGSVSHKWIVGNPDSWIQLVLWRRRLAPVRILTVGAAQLGPYACGVPRAAVVARLITLMKQAHGMGWDLIVHP